MKTVNIFLKLSIIFLFYGCTNGNSPIILVKNTLDFERTLETVELSSAFLKVQSLDAVGIREVASGKLQVTQLVDNDGDGVNDLLLFQPVVSALSESTYEILEITDTERPASKDYCYSRFVPERTDDYAWENNKVAFRVFGPVAQKMVEEGTSGGTLASGVDAWLKRVEYPIINKWYKNDAGGKSYHEDRGEGLDNFHVGKSRGVGGIAIKKDSIYYFSKNFTKWRTITTGPLRTSFYLEYEDWDAKGTLIKESKTISLDYGSHLSKFDLHIENSETISVGLTLHEKDGKVNSNNETWISYWQPHLNSELGMAVIVMPEVFSNTENYDVEATDLSNAFIQLKVNENRVTYYAGFGWKKAEQFKNENEWEEYLNSFSEKIQNPLIVKLINN